MRRASKATLKESVYDTLRTQILSGRLEPGSRLTEIELAARLKVSRTPLREALNRLERDGLVTSRPRHGYFVTMINIKTFEEAFDVREVLDGYAAQLAAERIGAGDKEKLRRLVEQCEALATLPNRSVDQYVEELQLGLEVHRIIARAAGNEMLQELLGRILDKCQHFVWMELVWLDEWRTARNEHAAIVEAVCSGGGARAAELARQHVRGSRNNISRFLRAKTAYREALARAS